MFTLQRPTQPEIRGFIARQSKRELSYPEAGVTRALDGTAQEHAQNQALDGRRVDHHRLRLGEGEELFQRAWRALSAWRMHRLSWVELLWPGLPLREGTTVGILTHLPGIYSLDACRIVYVDDERAEDDGRPVRRFGFAYGTLSGHVESGEERFSVEWHREDDSVWYDLLALSRPGHWLSRLGSPYTRKLQRRFAAESLVAMQQALA